MKLVSVKVRTQNHSSRAPGSGHILSGLTDNTTTPTLPLNQCWPSPSSTFTIISSQMPGSKLVPFLSFCVSFCRQDKKHYAIGQKMACLGDSIRKIIGNNTGAEVSDLFAKY